MAITITPQQEADLVRPATQLELERLVRAGGHIIQRGETLHIAELGAEDPITVPWVLISFGATRRRVLVMLVEEASVTHEAPLGRRAVIHHLPDSRHTESEATF